MISTSKLTYQYEGGQTIHFPNIELAQGAHALILGNSGTGKTTLLHLLSGLLRPKGGTISIQEKNINNLGEAALDTFRGLHIGLVFQVPHFMSALSVSENLALAQKLPGKTIDKQRIEDVLTLLNLASKINAYPHQLSQGEKQRVSIARAIINQPAVIFADEPTSALDNKNCFEVIKLLRDTASKNNATLVIVTHDNRLTKEFDQKIILEEL